MIDLTHFCSTEPDRPYLHQPFSHGDWTYATDARIAIRVPRRADVPENPDAPTKILAALFALFADDPGREMRPLTAFEIPDEAKQECPTCKGSKTQHACPSCSCPCPYCSIGIGDAIFDAKYVLMLAGLPNARIQASPGLGPTPCVFDGGEALLMPQRVRHDVHIELPA